MKKFKKLIPALISMFLSFSLMGTATFAWFSMNTTVTATGIEIEAKSDNTYLLISQTNDTAAAIQAENATSVTSLIGSSSVFPSAPALSDAEAAYLTVAAGHNTVSSGAIVTAGTKVVDATTAAAVTNWYTANALTPGSSAIDTTTARQLNSFDHYVIEETYYLTVAAGSNPATNLTVTPTITQLGGGNDVSACKAVVTTSDGGFAVLNNASGAVSIQGSNNITDTTVITIHIYIYYDGNDANVYTNNAANLTGASFTFAFNVTAVPAA